MQKKEKNITKNEIAEAILIALNRYEEKKTKESFALEIFKYPIIWMFRFLCFALGVLAISVVGTFILLIKDNKINNILNGISIGFFLLSVFLLLVLFIIYCWKISGEIKKEKDKNFIISYFSAIVAMVALIISVISYLN